MSSDQPLSITLIYWCVLDLIINTFILANLVLCQLLIGENILQEENLCPSFIVRIAAFITLALVIIGDVFNLVGLLMKKLTLIVLWQLSFFLYFILAYITLITSFATTTQMVLSYEVSLKLDINISMN